MKPIIATHDSKASALGQKSPEEGCQTDKDGR